MHAVSSGGCGQQGSPPQASAILVAGRPLGPSILILAMLYVKGFVSILVAVFPW